MLTNKCHCGIEIHKDRKYCSFKCRSDDPSFCKKLSRVKTAHYKDLRKKKETEDKKIATTLKNFGVEYPMQNVEIFKRQQASCFKKDENGLHGYEPFVYGYLKQLYSDLELGTDYLEDNSIEIKWLGTDNKLHRSYPDFFSKQLGSFIEVKSEYTRNLHNEKLLRCKEALYTMKYGYIICVVNPKKSFNFETFNEEYIGE
jgi:hypothetical protein